MPTYSYVCDACGHRFDHFQSINDTPVKECPVCGQEQARRLISAGAGLIFKGSGFYLTDYARKDQRNNTGTDRGNGKPAEGETSTKAAESKTADTKKDTD
jgi:putative FmdB family regulatory protein